MSVIEYDIFEPTFCHSTRDLLWMWSHGLAKQLIPALQKPARKIDKSSLGQYSFLLDAEIRLEIKASRVVASDSGERQYIKALPSKSNEEFDMNFQQLKPAHCEVFVWVAVWRDKIRYWVLSSEEVKANRYYSPGQHRGNVGEGQLHLKKENIAEFDPYECRSNELLQAIRAAYQRQMMSNK